ncbi:MAG TPA: dTDP-4-dehydrorhamnose 3,5-epimerase [Solirubrobacteraceae bacterium]|nr:dTDP-4-dehydrorhamnose 3,5-epimerase [Solirubrobacteraceae bacterium]
MIISPTELAGVALVELEPARDERGSFTRTFDADCFRAHGLDPRIVQCSTSFNARAGTLRGLHHQVAPHEESKLVRCVRGRVFDVVVDLRPASPTHRRWVGVELSADGARSLFVPAGCAHGFQTLVDDSEVLYQITAPYMPSAARGVRWDDPAFAIRWPRPPGGERLMSARDREHPDYTA